MPSPDPIRLLRSLATAGLLFVACGAPAVAAAIPQDGAPDLTVELSTDETAFQRFDSAASAFDGYVEMMRDGRWDAVIDSALLRGRSDDPDVRGALATDLYTVLLRTGFGRAQELETPWSGQADRAAFTVDHPALKPTTRTVGLARSDGLGWHFDPSRIDWVRDAARQLADVPPADEVLAELPLLEQAHHRIRTTLPDWLRARSFVIENWQWVGLALLLLIAVVLDRVMQVLLRALANRLGGAESIANLVPELGRFVRPGGLFAGALAFGVLLPAVGVDGQVRSTLAFASEFVATLAGIWALYRLVDLGCGVLGDKARSSSNRFDDLLVPLVHKTLRILVVVIGLVYLAAAWTDELWSIIAGLSIGSLAIGFAARDSIENLFGTFTVLTDKPFALGDWIDVDGIEGTVEAVGFRSTRIRTFYDSVLNVPNRKFISGVVDNFGRRKYRRIKTTLRLTVDTPPETVDAFCEAVRQLVRRHPYSADRSFHVYLNDLGASSLDVMLYTFVETPDWATELRERHRLLGDILRVARELGVRLSVPEQAITLQRPGEGVDAGGAVPDDALERGRALADALVDARLGPAGTPPPPPV